MIVLLMFDIELLCMCVELLYVFVVVFWEWVGSYLCEVMFVVDYLVGVNFVGYDLYGIGMILNYVVLWCEG